MIKIEFDIRRGGRLIPLDVSGHVTIGEAARLYGHPDLRHPGYPDDAEIEEVLLDTEPWDGELTYEEEERAKQELIEAYRQRAEEDAAEYEIDSREADAYFDYAYNLSNDPYGY